MFPQPRFSIVRDKSRNPATSKTELFAMIINSFMLLPVVIWTCTGDVLFQGNIIFTEKNKDHVISWNLEVVSTWNFHQ